MKKKLLFVLVVTFQLICAPMLFSQETVEGVYEYVEKPAKSVEPVYQDPTGVQVKFNEDGSFRAILASGEAELMFGDRKDIRLAIKKATIRAKAEIAKFINESVKSSDVMNEIINVAEKRNGKGGSEAVRETVESQVENLENSADAVLSGIVTLSQDINKDEKYVAVVLGVKEQTIKAASKLSSQIMTGVEEGKKTIMPTSSLSSQTGNQSQGQDARPSGREIRKSKMYEKF